MIILEKFEELFVPGTDNGHQTYAVSCVLGEEFKKNLIASIEQTDMSEIQRMTQTYIQNDTEDSVQLFSKLNKNQELPSVHRIFPDIPHPFFRQQKAHQNPTHFRLEF